MILTTYANDFYLVPLNDDYDLDNGSPYSGRGFSTIEVVVVCLILTSILSISIPMFTQTVSRQKMVSFAHELNGFLHRSVAEAVLRNHHLYILITQADSDTGAEHVTPVWNLTLFDADLGQGASPVFALESHFLDGLVLVPRYLNQRIEVDGVREKISNGHLLFYSDQNPDNALKIITSFGAGRIRICGATQAIYGYPRC
jgi:type IV fimbrial biogenesis protein FimT